VQQSSRQTSSFLEGIRDTYWELDCEEWIFEYEGPAVM
jgi:hypothetical protein